MFLIVQAGCDLRSRSTPELVWGVHGIKPGHLYKPRVAAFDAQDNLFLADLTDRIQVFDRDGHYLRGWLSEAIRIGPLVPLGECQVQAEWTDDPERPVDVYRLRVGQHNSQWAWLTPGSERIRATACGRGSLRGCLGPAAAAARDSEPRGRRRASNMLR